MNIHDILKSVHVLTACALVGPLMLTPGWLPLARHDTGRVALHDLHRLTGISGRLVLLSGSIMVLLQHGAMFSLWWMQLALVLFVAIQLFDHFWADRREQALEQNPQAALLPLKRWLYISI